MDPISRDFYEERRRKWRRSAFWRGFLIALLLIGGVWGVRAIGSGPPVGPHIAWVDVIDVIYGDVDRDAMLEDIADNDDVRALVLYIDSPGGTVVGSEALYEAVRSVASRKPVVSLIGGVGASGGYLAAIGGDHIVARSNSVTGSIGVILEYLTFGELLDRTGVAVETIRSSSLKADASLYRPLTAAGRAAEQAMVDETFVWFRDLVGQQRGLSGAALEQAADGRTFTGRTALELGLIDEIGGPDRALAYLESLDSSFADLPVETWQLEEADGLLLGILGRIGGFQGNLGPISLSSGPRLMAIYK